MRSLLASLVGKLAATVPSLNVNVPNQGEQSLDTPITNLLNTVYFLAGAVCVIIIITAGITYVTSAGNPQAITKAKNTIIGAVVGIIIIIMAYAITAFVAGAV
jgi:hypothetical protein